MVSNKRTIFFTLLFGLGISANAQYEDRIVVKNAATSKITSKNWTPAFIEASLDFDSNVQAAAGKSDVLVRCEAACTFLNRFLQGKVVSPKNSTFSTQNLYWSVLQSDVRSVCRVQPTTPYEVSAALITLKKLQCQFAVRSGGHAAFKGGSSIANGVTIDLGGLNKIEVSTDKTQVSLGPGNKWIDVYSKLDPLGISVVGGRVEDIGAGGFNLGGGISFLSNRYGFASDNINTYEVVTADGSIKQVTAKSDPDLFWALRGGGNNFGIVTRFDVKAYPQGKFWGGSQFIDISQAKPTIKALTEIAVSVDSDPYASLWVTFAYAQPFDFFLIIPQLAYGKPVESPPIFKNFTDIPNSADFRVDTLTGLINGSALDYGYRQTWWTATVHNDAALLERIFAIWQEEIAPLKAIEGWRPAIVFQPLSKAMLEKSADRTFGLTGSDGPLIMFNIALQWNNATDDEAVFASARNTVNRSVAEAKARGLSSPFIYQNYAANEQKVFEGYGSANYARLKAIAKKYDPEGVFQKLQPGYFKL